MNNNYIIMEVNDGTNVNMVLKYFTATHPEFSNRKYEVKGSRIYFPILESDTFSTKDIKESIVKFADVNITTHSNTLKIKKPSEITIKPTMSLEQRTLFAASILENTKDIGYKKFAYIPVELLNIQPYQRNRQNHLIKMAENWDDTKCTTLLVSYDKDKGWFNVLDGQHRAIAAKMRGIESLVCEIFTGLSMSDESLKFVETNINAKKLNPFDTFKANQYISDKDDTELSKIDKQLASVCKAHHVIVEKSSKCGRLKSVSNARKLIKTDGEECLDWVFDVIEKAHWNQYKDGYAHKYIEGLRLIYRRCEGNREYIKNKMIDIMSHKKPNEIAVLANMEFPSMSANGATPAFMCNLAFA